MTCHETLRSIPLPVWRSTPSKNVTRRALNKIANSRNWLNTYCTLQEYQTSRRMTIECVISTSMFSPVFYLPFFLELEKDDSETATGFALYVYSYQVANPRRTDWQYRPTSRRWSLGTLFFFILVLAPLLILSTSETRPRSPSVSTAQRMKYYISPNTPSPTEPLVMHVQRTFSLPPLKSHSYYI